MIAIIDYGMGNLGSIYNMLKKIGQESIITNDHKIISKVDKKILPGVGAFDTAVENLERLGLISLLNKIVIEGEKPILGICLGMQLFSKSSEEGTLPGLGWVNAETIRFRFNAENVNLRIPHMGWNRVTPKQDHPIFKEMPVDSRFYFVHSYHVYCNDESNILATAEYGITFNAAIIHKNIIGTQFHPEKSHKFGIKILKNFVDMHL
jgi:glutamine amidotransferase